MCPYWPKNEVFASFLKFKPSGSADFAYSSSFLLSLTTFAPIVSFFRTVHGEESGEGPWYRGFNSSPTFATNMYINKLKLDSVS